jgi:Zn-dependent protease with chaperone function
MTDFLELLTAWLLDFYVLATVLLAAEGLAASLVRRPARRLALARATLIGLAFLAVLLALPGRARWRAGDVSPPVPLLAGIFLIGLILTTSWLLLGGVRAWLVARRSRPAPSHLRQAMHDVVGSDDPPRLRVGSDLRQPAVLGVWWPVLLVPADLAYQASPRQLEAVLAHEWAHVKNGDLRWAALSRVLLLVLFAHPLYWILRRRMRADQEMQADATAAGQTGAIDYAATLVGFAGTAGHLEDTLPLVRRRPVGCTPLKRRIAALLHPDFCADDHWAPRLHLAAALLAVLAVAMLSPVTLRELGEPRTVPSTATVAQAPAVAPQSAPVDTPPVVKIEIVVQVPPAQPPQAPPRRFAVNRVDLTLFVIDWLSKYDWFQRLFRLWLAEHLSRPAR